MVGFCLFVLNEEFVVELKQLMLMHYLFLFSVPLIVDQISSEVLRRPELCFLASIESSLLNVWTVTVASEEGLGRGRGPEGQTSAGESASSSSKNTPLLYTLIPIKERICGITSHLGRSTSPSSSQNKPHIKDEQSHTSHARRGRFPPLRPPSS